MSGYRDPGQYWEQRLRESFDLRGAGYALLGPEFNAVLYQARGTALERTLAATGGSLAGLRVLEVGCGTGFYAAFCRSQQVAAYTGVDVTQVSVSNLADRYPDYQFLRAELGSDAFPKMETFDVVLAADVLFHIVDDLNFQRAMEQLASCLGTGGRLIISDIFPCTAQRSAVHMQLRSREQYAVALAQQHLRIGWVEPVFAMLQPPVGLARAGVLWRLYARLWQHVLLRAARHPSVDRNLPRLLSRLDALVLRRLGPTAPNTKWMVAEYETDR